MSAGRVKVITKCKYKETRKGDVGKKLKEALKKFKAEPLKAIGKRDCPFCHKKMVKLDGTCWNCQTYSRATDSLEKRFYSTVRSHLPYDFSGEADNPSFHNAIRQHEEEAA
jgi:hypothetical protein